MTSAADFPVTNPALRPNGSTGPGAVRPGPVLRRVALPVAEPAFDDEIGRPGGRPRPVPATGRIAYLPRGRAAGQLPTAVTHRPAATHPGAVRSVVAAPVPLAPARPAPRLHLVSPADPAVPDADVPARSRAVSPVRSGPPVQARTRTRDGGTSDGRTEVTGVGPGPRLVVDSTTTRSRLLGGADDADPTGARAAASPLPDPRPMAVQIVQAVVEVLSGDRQVTQLVSWVDEEVYAAVAAAAPRFDVGRVRQRRAIVTIRPQDRPLVRSVHVSDPATGVTEVSARVQVGRRSRAVALRLEEWRGRWRCNALTVG